MKSKLTALVLANALALGSVSAVSAVGPENQPIIGFGVLPIDLPETMAKRFEPLTAYLERETGYDFVLKTYPTGSKSGGYTAAVRAAVQELLVGGTPFAYLSPVTIAQARHHDQAIEPVVCAVRSGSPTYVGQIVVRKDSDLQRPEDLGGRRVIGANPSSISGNLMPSRMLMAKGIEKSNFAAMDFAGGHENAAQAVLDGRYDAAWINNKNFQKRKHQGVGLRAIWVHDPVPYSSIAVNTRYVRPEVLEKVRTALLEIHEKNLAAIQTIDPKYEKWVSIRWEDYAPVKQTIDAVHGVAFYELKD